MYEIASFLSRSRKPLPLCIIQFPSGKFGFVGHGPVELFYSGPADLIEVGRRHGFGLVLNRGVKTCVWDTREEAAAAAAAIGAKVTE